MSIVRPRLNQLNIVSANPEASLEFYRRLGVEIPEDAVWRTRTGVHHASAKRTADQAALDLYVKLTGAGYATLQAPNDAFWGARYAVVEDPDGIAVGLMSPISPEMRSQ